MFSYPPAFRFTAKETCQGDGLLSWLGQRANCVVCVLFLVGCHCLMFCMPKRFGSTALSPRLLHEHPGSIAQSPDSEQRRSCDPQLCVPFYV